ncbi:MAG: glutamine--fructose-6-phosphate aminotransferase [isomerizing] [Ignavibacteriaceae bacterium]|nr:MAG: glutamine--fructose-6-phosphate aminotransferase [isomerizing] [Ignavibacteriaceae bacterium]
MCGIVGYIGNKSCVPVVVEGLKRLEYRGYDSAGIGVIRNGKIEVTKIKGKVAQLQEAIENSGIDSTIGIGHTRWATHGEPNELNAHPHSNGDGTLILIHNGIIENYSTLKTGLKKHGYDFKSATDTEVLAHLFDTYLKEGYTLFEAVRRGLNEVEGTYGIAVISTLEPDRIVAAKKGSPLLLGVGEGENFVASDVSAILQHTKQVVYLEDGEIAEVFRDHYLTKTIEDEEVNKVVHQIEMTLDEIDKGGYPTFMLKEIMEQPESLKNSIRGRLLSETGDVKLGGLESSLDHLLYVKRIIITACGTSWHSALVGKYMFETFLRIPTEVEYASEFRYRNPIVGPGDAVFFISQSGETADTLAALKEAKRRGALCLGICNVVGSSIARESHSGVYIHAGPEIGVASTKAFTSQLTVFALITILLARRKGMSFEEGKQLVEEFKKIPDYVKIILKQNDLIEEIAEQFKNATNFLYLGRGYNFPVALEGALKLKEISYIHAEGYPAAEMKHGPIALVDENMPVVFIAPKDATYDKIISNIEEIKARKGRVIAIATSDDENIDDLADYSIKIPGTRSILMPILTVIPLQLLAYHIAMKKGLNVDQPRNLAKSVTVE